MPHRTRVDEHHITFFESAICQSLRREDVLDVPSRNGIARRKHVAVVQVLDGIRHCQIEWQALKPLPARWVFWLSMAF
jgi:hypothetical protein